MAAFYAERLPPNIASLAAFERWREEAERGDPRLLHFTREGLMRHAAAAVTEALFPDALEMAGARLPLKYRFAPGHALDGLTLTVPLALLNQLDETRLSWLVPGMIRDKVRGTSRRCPRRCATDWCRCPSGSPNSSRPPRRGRAAAGGDARLAEGDPRRRPAGGCLGRRGPPAAPGGQRPVVDAAGRELAQRPRPGRAARPAGRGGADDFRRERHARSSGRDCAAGTWATCRSRSTLARKGRASPATRRWSTRGTASRSPCSTRARRPTQRRARGWCGSSASPCGRRSRATRRARAGFTQAACSSSRDPHRPAARRRAGGRARPCLPGRGSAAALGAGVRRAGEARADAPAGGRRGRLPAARGDRRCSTTRCPSASRRCHRLTAASPPTCGRSGTRSSIPGSSPRRRGRRCSTCRVTWRDLSGESRSTSNARSAIAPAAQVAELWRRYRERVERDRAGRQEPALERTDGCSRNSRCRSSRRS